MLSTILLSMALAQPPQNTYTVTKAVVKTSSVSSSPCDCPCGCAVTGVCTCPTVQRAAKTAAPAAPPSPQPTAPVIRIPAALPAGWHTHQCRYCGAQFSHGAEANGNASAHRCPACGRTEYGNIVTRSSSRTVTRSVAAPTTIRAYSLPAAFGGCPNGNCPNLR